MAENLVLQLDKGTYYICTCGSSKNFPYCDGAHKGTGKAPQVLELQEAQTVEIQDVRP